MHTNAHTRTQIFYVPWKNWINYRRNKCLLPSSVGVCDHKCVHVLVCLQDAVCASDIWWEDNSPECFHLKDTGSLCLKALAIYIYGILYASVGVEWAEITAKTHYLLFCLGSVQFLMTLCDFTNCAQQQVSVVSWGLLNEWWKEIWK